MKKIITLAVLLITGLALTGCGSSSAQQQSNASGNIAQAAVPDNNNNNSNNSIQNSTTSNKVLVVYFSHSGNTREIARQIQQKVGGDILELQTVTPYPEVYNAVTEQARRELDSGFKPKLKPVSENIQSYDTIYVGSPNWWSTIAPPVITFLTQYDMSGKTIIPFITHEGSGLGRSMSHIKELCPKATVRDGLAVRGGNVRNAQDDVTKWLR